MLTTILVPVIFALAVQNPTASQNEPPVVITTGEGVVKMAPDRLWVSIAAESRSKAPKDAQRANADAMKTVLDRLKALGLPADAIRTTGYDLQPEFDFANGKQTLRG